jgi:hypothetical protein
LSVRGRILIITVVASLFVMMMMMMMMMLAYRFEDLWVLTVLPRGGL